LGIQTASFIAFIGAAGLAVGFALQGSLANFAAGFLMIMLKPFKVGDFVDAAGIMGSVTTINIFNSVFTTPDNKVIVLPNAAIMGGAITNYTGQEKRRVDLKIGVSYNSEVKKVKEVIGRVIDKHELIHKDPEPLIRLAEMADSSLNYNVRVWTNTSDYWTLFYDLNEQIKEELDKNGISIPFPQMDVHLINK
jgi:small conductance mechanosensitive channel